MTPNTVATAINARQMGKLKATDPVKANGSDDPDNDKVVNLDEFRHGADPNNADTDVMSVGDGILQGRNPLVSESAVLAVINDLILSD